MSRCMKPAKPSGLGAKATTGRTRSLVNVKWTNFKTDDFQYALNEFIGEAVYLKGK